MRQAQQRPADLGRALGRLPRHFPRQLAYRIGGSLDDLQALLDQVPGPVGQLARDLRGLIGGALAASTTWSTVRALIAAA